MTIVGVLLLFAGLGIFGMVVSGSAPDQIMQLPVPAWAWLVLAGVGGLLIMLNRRPGN